MNANIARHLDRMAAGRPTAPALKVPRGRTATGSIDYLTLSFSELLAETQAWQARFKTKGVRQGDRVLVMVRPGLPLVASAFALFKLGAVPVIIDPGMGLKSFLTCVHRSKPRVVVGIPLAQLLSHVCRGPFGSVEIRVPVSGSLTKQIRGSAQAPEETQECEPLDLAAILFTSGSTGAPKGVRYEHGMFDSQVGMIRETYGIEVGEVDLPLLPLFALFNPALGMTSVIPEMDPRRPSATDPAKLVQAIRQENVTNSFGSPTLWRKIAAHCAEHHTTLPSLKRVLCAGAPVPADLWTASRAFLPKGRLHSPYGATEALPVSTVSVDEIDVKATSGACVGRPVAGVEVRILPISDEPLRGLQKDSGLPAGSVGEIIVRGPNVTREYDGMPEATAAAKIPDFYVENGFWHRMGDCGYLDGHGRLHFLGRKAERVIHEGGILFTEPCEQVFRVHPRAQRCALVAVASEPALVAETTIRDESDARALASELRTLAVRNPQTAVIRAYYFKGAFPVDVRHNAKINRLALARWAIGQKPQRPADPSVGTSVSPWPST